MMNGFVLVFLGSGIGGVLRHGVSLVALRHLGPAFPHATVTVNVVGSFVLGLLVGWFAAKADPGHAWRLFLATGILGRLHGEGMLPRHRAMEAWWDGYQGIRPAGRSAQVKLSSTPPVRRCRLVHAIPGIRAPAEPRAGGAGGAEPWLWWRRPGSAGLGALAQGRRRADPLRVSGAPGRRPGARPTAATGSKERSRRRP